jgi:Fe-S cluster assembly protein SufD
MDSASRYLSLEDPKKADHLWRYTPWKRVHPTGDVTEIPSLGEPEISLSVIDGSDLPSGIAVKRGVVEDLDFSMSNALTNSFLHATAKSSQWTLVVDRGFSSKKPIVLDIETGDLPCTAHISLDIGKMSEFEMITRVTGRSEWFGLLRTGEIRDEAVVNDVVIGLLERGTMLRSDSIEICRNAQVRVGTVSSGSEKTKSDLRYKMGEPGGNIKVLGSILSVDSMHLDHHIEIHHEAPETFSRLSWHSACGGSSRTIGTGMLTIREGSKGADAAQIFRNLLLSEKAEADSIPELEVMENDVVGCGHGTANGPIDEEQMFYLKARGFDEDDAKRSLIAAFLNSTLSEMGGSDLHEWLVGELTLQLEALEA